MERRWRSGRFFAWFALALLGLVVAAAVSLAASRLSSQHIGLSSEPLSAGRGLAPAVRSATTTSTITSRKTTHHRSGKRKTTTTVQTTTVVVPQPSARSPAPAPAKPAPKHGDDSGGSRHGGRDD